MAHAHRGTYGGLRLHRVFLQSTPAPLGAPLSQSSTVREENPQPDHRGLTVTCPRKRGNSKQWICRLAAPVLGQPYAALVVASGTGSRYEYWCTRQAGP